MALVDYSDSDASDAEQLEAQQTSKHTATAPTTATTTTTTTTTTASSSSSTTTSNFSTAKLVDKANPAKIRVKLGGSQSNALASHGDEPAAKRPRTGGAFSGFNAQLPPPKHDADKAAAGKPNAPKSAVRKVFSLKTGAEPAFSRESDAELRQLFAEQDSDTAKPIVATTTTTTNANSTTKPIPTNAFMFKPLSVARPKSARAKPKKLPAANNSSVTSAPTSEQSQSQPQQSAPATATASASAIPPTPPPPPKKISLFSSGEPVDIPDPVLDEDDTSNTNPVDSFPDPDPYTDPDPAPFSYNGSNINLNTDHNPQPQTLSSIADDLNLSEADKRQLFGRSRGSGASHNAATTALNITNFNTDHEYAANQELIAKGDQVMHNPVRAIAPGKHSLRQLVNVAQGQKEALEDSFAMGKRNKKEAGSKYGW